MITLESLRMSLHHAWGPDTILPNYRFDEKRPSRGQCVPTALVVQDCLGGNILCTWVAEEGRKGIEMHYWNELPGGLEVDLTRDQYSDKAVFGQTKVRTRTFSASTRRRADILFARFQGVLIGRRISIPVA